MRIPFRRRKAEPVVSRELAASIGVALAAADRGEIEDLGSFEQYADDEPDDQPKRGPAIHLRYISGTLPTTACGKWIAVAWLTAEPADVTCGACRNTRLYKTRSSPGATPAPGTTRKQET